MVPSRGVRDGARTPWANVDGSIKLNLWNRTECISTQIKIVKVQKVLARPQTMKNQKRKGIQPEMNHHRKWKKSNHPQISLFEGKKKLPLFYSREQ